MDASTSIPRGIARAVIGQDIHDQRFERFCCDLVSDIEGGVLVVPTSASWDRGRDGRSIGGDRRVLLCASITADLDDKIKSDIKRIAATGIRFAKVYFCTTRDTASEHTLDAIAAQIRAWLPNHEDIEPLNGEQIAHVLSSFPRAMWTHYRSEVEDVWRNIMGEDGTDDAHRRSWLLALATAGHENSTAIRDACYRAILLRTLGREPASANEMAKRVSDALCLGRPIPARVVSEHLDRLVADGMATPAAAGSWTRSPAGDSAADDESRHAAVGLLAGRRDIRLHIEKAIGFGLSDSQFTGIWDAVEQRLAHLFLTQGHRIVEVVSAIVAAAPPAESGDSHVDLPFFVEDMAAAASATCAGTVIEAEVNQAVRDLFAEREGVAYDWMTRVCTAYITVCTLGLEATSGARLKEALAHTHLIFDTDILLDFLGEGEPEHDASVRLIREWRGIGGTLLLARPVAEEVAYHAHIAQRDFDEGNRFMRTVADRRRFLKNVFTRAFGTLVEKGKVRPGDWRRYIDGFRGRTPYDPTVVRELLREDEGFKDLPDVSVDEGPAAAAWDAFRQEIESAHVHPDREKERLDKARRDARLFGAMAEYGAALRERSGGAACVLVTSSGRLRRVGEGLEADGTWTLALAEATYLLGLVPGVSVGMSGLRTLLFDGRLTPKHSAFELLVLRTLHDAGYTFPSARRAGLLRSVRTALVKRAKETGESRLVPEALTSAEADPTVRQAFATIMVEAVDAVGGESRAERENIALRKRVKELEDSLARKR